MAKKQHILLLLCACAAVTCASAAQDSLYRIKGILGGGYVYNLSTFDYGVDGLSRNGGNAFARLMWSPEHILDLGVEFGFTNLYGVDPPEGRAVQDAGLVAYPIYLVLSMTPITNWSASIGFGSAILSSVVNDGSTVTGVTSMSTSVFAAVQYLAPITDNMRIGGEARLSSFDRYRDANMSFNVLLTYDLIQY